MGYVMKWGVKRNSSMEGEWLHSTFRGIFKDSNSSKYKNTKNWEDPGGWVLTNSWNWPAPHEGKPLWEKGSLSRARQRKQREYPNKSAGR